MYGPQKPKYPQLELRGWRCQYTGRYRSFGISDLQKCISVGKSEPLGSSGRGEFAFSHGTKGSGRHPSAMKLYKLVDIVSLYVSVGYLCQSRVPKMETDRVGQNP